LSYIAELQDVIRKLHRVESKHVHSVPLKETPQGKTVWEGVVEVFGRIGHPKALKVYVWLHENDDGEVRHVTELHLAPVDSPEAAVRASIVRDYRLGEEA
jgi:hypothetical protein